MISVHFGQFGLQSTLSAWALGGDPGDVAAAVSRHPCEGGILEVAEE